MKSGRHSQTRHSNRQAGCLSMKIMHKNIVAIQMNEHERAQAQIYCACAMCLYCPLCLCAVSLMRLAKHSISSLKSTSCLDFKCHYMQYDVVYVYRIV